MTGNLLHTGFLGLNSNLIRLPNHNKDEYTSNAFNCFQHGPWQIFGLGPDLVQRTSNTYDSKFGERIVASTLVPLRLAVDYRDVWY